MFYKGNIAEITLNVSLRLSTALKFKLHIKFVLIISFIHFLGFQILLADRIKQFSNSEYKTQTCKNSIKSNAALQLHQIKPVDMPRKKIEVTTIRTVFPNTNLPEVKFKTPALACPALFGNEKKPVIIYIQLVTYFKKEGKLRTFALLKSRRKPGAVYPVTLIQNKADFSSQLTLGDMKEEIPSIYEDDELSPVIEEPEAEASTSSGTS